MTISGTKIFGPSQFILSPMSSPVSLTGKLMLGVGALVLAAALTVPMADAKKKPAPAPVAQAQTAPEAKPSPPPLRAPDINVDIPFEKFTLANGLRVIVSTDKKAPVVAVGIWYHVGSKDERPGRTGFAHLFEHLMFQGTENFKGEWIEAMETIGATDLNGTTWFDRTNYFQTVPKTALDQVLWLESDRMGHFINSVDQKKLDEQRGVVQNEKRQGDNQPYGRLQYSQLAGLFPGGHPYSWSTIGSLEDLAAASLADVKEWFASYYGPSNAVLVLAGDVEVTDAKKLAEKYFGNIKAGPPLARREAAVPERKINTRDRLEDKVPQAMLSRAWATPGDYTKEAAYLELASRILGGGKTSRLFKALVYDAQLATSATFSSSVFEIASMPDATVLIKPGSDFAQAEKILDRTISDFRANGPTEDELLRAKTAILAGVARSLEKVGGFSGKTVTLGESELYGGDPAAYKTYLSWIRDASTADVKAFANKWLGDGWHQVDVTPVPALTASGTGADRSKLPVVASSPEISFPAIETATLSNGIKVSLARRTATPVVEVSLVFDAGYAADNNARPGLAAFTLDMLDEGTKTRSALAISEEAQGLGAQISTTSNLDLSTAEVSALRINLQPSLDLLADVVRNPVFAGNEFSRLQRQRLAQIGQEKAQPQGVALRLLPPALYGTGHAYGKPFSGTGTEAVISGAMPADLIAFKDAWIRPDNVEIFAAGDVTLAELTAALEKSLAGWTAPTTPKGVKTITPIAAKPTRVAIIDRPDSPQTLIIAGRLAPPTGVPQDLALGLSNDVFGGAFSSRINFNLRETKGWSYGSFSAIPDARGQRPFLILAPVQTDKTTESLAEIRKEITDFLGKRPATSDEIGRARGAAVRSLPGQYETNDAVLAAMINNARFGRPADYVATLTAKYNALTDADVRATAKDVVKPDDLLWILVGDAKKIEAGVKAAGLGTVEYWDSDGNKLK